MLSPLPAQLLEQPRPAGTAATPPGPSRAPPTRTAPICRGAPPEAGLRLEELRPPVVGTPREAGITSPRSPGKACPSASRKSRRRKTIAAKPVILPRTERVHRPPSPPPPCRCLPSALPRIGARAAAAAAPAAGAAVLLGGAAEWRRGAGGGGRRGPPPAAAPAQSRPAAPPRGTARLPPPSD